VISSTFHSMAWNYRSIAECQ